MTELEMEVVDGAAEVGEVDFDGLDIFGEDEPAEDTADTDNGADENGKEDLEQEEDRQEATEQKTVNEMAQEAAGAAAEVVPLRQVTQAEPNEDLQYLDQMAATAGMSRQAYLNNLKTMEENKAVQMRAVQLMAANQSLEEGAALQMARLEYQNKQLESKIGQLTRPQQEAEERQKEIREDLSQLVRLYPDLKEFPPEVVQAVEGGIKPSLAYLQHLLKQKDIELSQWKQAQQNAAKNPGSVKGDGGRDIDPFEQGFLCN